MPRGKAKKVCGATKKNQRVDGHPKDCPCEGCRCQLPAGFRTEHLGIGHCSRHGGSTETHTRSAQMELARQECTRLGIPLAVDPGAALVGLVREAAGNVEFYRRLVQDLPIHPTEDELDFDDEGKPHYRPGKTGIYGRTYHVSGIPTGEAKPHILLVLYNEERDRLETYTVAALKAGVDERRLQLEAADAEELMAGVVAGIQSANLTPKQAEQFRRAFAEHIRKVGDVDTAHLTGGPARSRTRARRAVDATSKAGTGQRARRAG